MGSSHDVLEDRIYDLEIGIKEAIGLLTQLYNITDGNLLPISEVRNVLLECLKHD